MRSGLAGFNFGAESLCCWLMAGRLYTASTYPRLPNLLMRVALVLGLLVTVVLVLYFEGGMRDSKTGEHPDFLDCVYFALITITTVGYGDIVPETTLARLVDAFFLTPVRFLVLFIFLGTAYQLAFRRFQEEYRMKRAVDKLEGHVIVCGFGGTGRAAVQELLLQGTAPGQIVVLAMEEACLQEAAELGVVAVNGDATREAVLKSVAVERAAHVLICSGRDDTAVLVSLTAHDLNSKAQVIAVCREQENAKLLERSGAHTIVSPATAGGTLMAAATRRAHLVETMQDILSVGGKLQLDERPVSAAEVGKRPGELAGMAVLRVYRDSRYFDVADLPQLEPGDIIVFVAAGAAHER